MYSLFHVDGKTDHIRIELNDQYSCIILMIILIDYAGRGLCSLVTEKMYIVLLFGAGPFIPAMLSCLLTLISTDFWFKDEEPF